MSCLDVVTNPLGELLSVGQGAAAPRGSHPMRFAGFRVRRKIPTQHTWKLSWKCYGRFENLATLNRATRIWPEP